jgi:hypothetical protein
MPECKRFVTEIDRTRKFVVSSRPSQAPKSKKKSPRRPLQVPMSEASESFPASISRRRFAFSAADARAEAGLRGDFAGTRSLDLAAFDFQHEKNPTR